jgi:hypothetical protein
LSIHPGRTAIADYQLERVLQQVPPTDFSVETPKPPFRVGLGFAIERDLELPNLLGSFYPFGAISWSFAPLLRVRTSALPLRVLPQLCAVSRVQPQEVHDTMEDSDFCDSRFRLTGGSGLYERLSCLTATDLPAFTARTSRHAVHADPAGVLPPGRLFGDKSSAFTRYGSGSANSGA